MIMQAISCVIYAEKKLKCSGTFWHQSRLCAHLSASFLLSNLRQPSTRAANSAPAQAKIRRLLSREFLLEITVCGQKSGRQPTTNQSVGPAVRSSQTQKEECTRDLKPFFCSPAFKVHQFDWHLFFVGRIRDFCSARKLLLEKQVARLEEVRHTRQRSLLMKNADDYGCCWRQLRRPKSVYLAL